MSRSGADASRSIVQRADALLRSLVGISQAKVQIRPTGGVERVRVVADGGQSNGQMIQNIRSALLAALGVVVQPGQIEFVPAAAWTTPSEPEAPAAPTPTPTPPPAAVPGNGLAAAPAAPAAAPQPLLPALSSNGTSGHGNGVVAAQNGNGVANGGPSVSLRSDHGYANGARRQRARPTVSAPAFPAPAAPSATAEPAPNRLASSLEVAIGTRAVRLDRVEIVRQAGRVRCRVLLVAGEDRFSAVAESADGPQVEFQLAARVTCDALRAGDLTTTHFQGATVAQLAGGLHVLVALNGWKGGAAIRRSGSALIRESAEEAAALAVLHALANT